MREALLMLGMVALLMLAAALLLWQWAAGRQARNRAALHVERQLLTRIARPEPGRASVGCTGPHWMSVGSAP